MSDEIMRELFRKIDEVREDIVGLKVAVEHINTLHCEEEKRNKLFFALFTTFGACAAWILEGLAQYLGNLR